MVKQAWRNYALVAAVMLMPAAGCAREPEQVGLSAITFNYSDDNIVFVWINGKQAGVGKDPVKPGGVTGGSVMCCINLASGQQEVAVKVQTTKDTYTTTARIEQPWTKYPHYAVVHVLPKRKVIVQIAALMTAPRKDLLDQRLSELGIPAEVESPPHMMDYGPSADVE